MGEMPVFFAASLKSAISLGRQRPRAPLARVLAEDLQRLAPVNLCAGDREGQTARNRHMGTETRHSAIIRYALCRDWRPDCDSARSVDRELPGDSRPTSSSWRARSTSSPSRSARFSRRTGRSSSSAAIDPDLWRNAGFTEEPPNHFLDFDAYGPYPFKDLPREYDEALKKHGIDKLRQNGLVPWRTHEIAGRLIRGFEALHKNGPYAQSDIRFFSAIIGHYVADAHVPLHAVLNYNGQLTGQTGHSQSLGRRALHPLPEAARHQARRAECRSRNERDFVFETLLESSQLADDVLAADKKAIGDREVYDDQVL